jgi:hypothetical protein
MIVQADVVLRMLPFEFMFHERKWGAICSIGRGQIFELSIVVVDTLLAAITSDE